MSDAMQIPLLERALGGLLPGHAYLFHGVSGVGKTVLALQVARAWTGANRRVLFVTGDAPESLLDQASLLGLSLQQVWEDGRLVLCSYTAGAAGEVRTYGMRALLDRLGGVAQGASALILDPVTPVFEAFSSGAEIERDVRMLCDTLREQRWSVACVADTNDLRQRPGLREALGSRCAGVLELCHSRGRSNPAESPFLLKIERARQVTPSGGVVPYAIALEAGLIPVAPPSDEAEEARTGSHQARQARVLIAGSEDEELLALAKLLGRTMEVERVGDGATALSRAATWGPDVLLLQADLPQLSGYAVCRALRQGRYTVPVILMTGKGRRRSDRVRALLNGATDLIQTPFDLREAAARVRTASRMRVASLETGVEQHLLDVLSARAQDNLLEVPEFLEGLGIALRAAARFSSPVSLVTFEYANDPDSASDESPWGRFREALQRGVRSGDMLCYPTACRAATLLCHEGQGGALAFIDRVRGLAEETFGLAALLEAPWRIEAASLTIEASFAGTADVRALLEQAFEDAQPFIGAGEEGQMLRPTGTGGE